MQLSEEASIETTKF